MGFPGAIESPKLAAGELASLSAFLLPLARPARGLDELPRYNPPPPSVFTTLPLLFCPPHFTSTISAQFHIIARFRFFCCRSSEFSAPNRSTSLEWLRARSCDLVPFRFVCPRHIHKNPQSSRKASVPVHHLHLFLVNFLDLLLKFETVSIGAILTVNQRLQTYSKLNFNHAFDAKQKP